MTDSAHKPLRVLVTGVFDLLHEEHIAFLEKARAVGDELWVGIESDVRVRQMKGEGRPVQTQAVRQAAIAQLGLADKVFILPEQFASPADHERLIASIKPAILAVSSHTAHLDKKAAILAKYGGRVVVVHEHNQQISTTQKLQRLTSL